VLLGNCAALIVIVQGYTSLRYSTFVSLQPSTKTSLKRSVISLLFLSCALHSIKEAVYREILGTGLALCAKRLAESATFGSQLVDQ
jgi:hypothetical protein